MSGKIDGLEKVITKLAEDFKLLEDKQITVLQRHVETSAASIIAALRKDLDEIKKSLLIMTDAINYCANNIKTCECNKEILAAFEKKLGSIPTAPPLESPQPSKSPTIVKEQLLDYYMANDHNEWTNKVIQVLSCEDPEIEQAPNQYEDLNILVAVPNPRYHQNLHVEIDETVDENMGTTQAETSAAGAARNPTSGVSYDRPSRSRPTRSHSATYQSAPVGGSYRSGTGRFQRYNIPEDYMPEKKYQSDILDIDCVDQAERRRRIQAWHNSLRLIIATDSNLMDDMVLAHVLMISKSTRMAHDLIEGINQDEFMRGSSEDFLQNIVNMLSTVFLGTNYLNDGENQVKIKQEEARDRMTKLQICDLCYLDQFTCDYEEALLNVPNTEWIGYIEGYLRKVPYIGKESLEEYQALPHISKLSLIVAKNIVSKKLTKICTDRQLLKKTKKINLCCPEFQGPETM
ncbi:hypothetical protein POTOM_019723 [Populus tomentosa]|uniref:Uncharacterized protein n=1 Tax=Populus tomentosa TaxID=118781 RepID=A0A8X7ZXM5_POPTO|nr:hypothetical protein POTOM_019723 [Populus tomentosa]